MQKLISIKKNFDIIYDSTITEYLSVDNVYVSIKNNYHVLVKVGDDVLKNQIIMENNLNKVLSPVSGKVIGKARKYIKDKLTDVLVIANDFREKEKIDSKKVLKFDKESIISRLYEHYFKYYASLLETNKYNNLVINVIEDEPYILTNSYVLNKNIKETLDMIDIICSAFNIGRALIAIKSNDTKNINKLITKIGTYPYINVALVEDKYLIGKDFFLRKALNLHNRDTIVIDLQTFLEMYEAVKYNKNVSETYITIAGENIKRSKILKVKVGSLLSEIVDSNIKVIKNDSLYIIDGVMTGYECDINNTIVTKNTKGLIITNKDNIKEENCSNCGLCYKVCPVKVNPKKIMDTKCISNSCLDCGLCSYVCPAFINLRKYLKGEK